MNSTSLTTGPKGRLQDYNLLTRYTGSGKSTLSKLLTSTYPNFHHLSIDKTIYNRHGLYNIDYEPSLYARYQSEADELFRTDTIRLLQTTPPSNLILDRSFYAKSDRCEYRQIVQDAGGKAILVNFDVEREVLWRRIQERTSRARDADSAFEVTEEVLDSYLGGFEVPLDEEQVVIKME